ncbi:hypothetical protein FRC12_002661 [Ceratobasidium sp. 428]|nr:hypothetical protein FRC12_002661 [Ceratobasidium sp. 428]
MPIPRRQRKSEPAAVAGSPTKSNGAGADSVNSSEMPTVSDQAVLVESNHEVSGCDSSARQGAVIDESLSFTNSSENCGTLTVDSVPSGTPTPSPANTLKPSGEPEPAQSEEATSTEINYLPDPPDNPFKVAALPASVQEPKPNKLHAEMLKSRQHPKTCVLLQLALNHFEVGEDPEAPPVNPPSAKLFEDVRYL